jgi:hypothetical protein
MSDRAEIGGFPQISITPSVSSTGSHLRRARHANETNALVSCLRFHCNSVQKQFGRRNRQEKIRASQDMLGPL